MAEEIQTNRRGEIRGVVCLAGALFLFLSLFSYHPLDPSFTHFTAGDAPIHNLAGTVGSHTADTLARLFGFGVFWFPVVLVIAGLKSLLEREYRLTVIGVAGFVGLMCATTGLFAVTIPRVLLHGVDLPTGGLAGQLLARLLLGYFNLAGAYLILTALLIVSLMVLVDFSLVVLARRLFQVTVSGVHLLSVAIPGGIEALRQWRSRPDKDKKTKAKKAAPVIAAGSAEPRRAAKPEQIPLPLVMPAPGQAFQLPPLTLLDPVQHRELRQKKETLVANSRVLENKLADFGVEARVLEVRPGPVITMYELEPAPGVKIHRITNLTDDLALALKAPSIRIIAPIPGKAAIGIEIPNPDRDEVHLRDVLDHNEFRTSPCRLPIALGVDIVGQPVVTDLIRMPHLLIAGTTGSGKSVSLNAMICSILFKAPPDEVKFLMIDPKRLELSAYEGIPHLLHPVVVDPKKASQVLRWAVEEMERRYQIIGERGVKGIEAFNELVKRTAAEKKGSPARAASLPSDGGPSPEAEAPPPPAPLPYIVIVIDELADLMLVAQRNVEESLARLAQMARAAGIHLILATQRPSVDVITGVIKANFPTRISFQVSSKVDSRTILDVQGAENLLGAGDMLFIPPGTSKLNRIHGAYVSDAEIERIVFYVKQQGQPAYDESIAQYRPDAPEGDKEGGDLDEKYDEAVELVTDLGQASISLVQRYLKVGYNRAARIIERMESEGVVGPSDGVKPRKVLARKLPR